MSKDPDTYAIWGDWDLQQFRVQIARWRDITHPPDDRFDHANRWWPSLKQSVGRSGAVKALPENDPEGNLWWVWIPQADWIDDDGAFWRVACYFRRYENDNPPRLVCDQFRTVQTMSPDEVDRADGMG